MEIRSNAAAYPEWVTLRDGRAVTVSPVTPDAKPLIAAAMAKLSPQTSRRRFFTVRYQLSDAELDRMTALDGITAFALGAVARDRDGTLHGVGVARYATDVDDPTTAEMAILVVDAYQGLGLGKLLVTRLAAEARARGVDRLRALVLPDNDVVIGMLARHAPSIAIERYGDELRTDISTQLAPPRPVHAWAPY